MILRSRVQIQPHKSGGTYSRGCDRDGHRQRVLLLQSRLRGRQEAAVVEPVAAGEGPDFCCRTRDGNGSGRMRYDARIFVRGADHVQVVGLEGRF